MNRKSTTLPFNPDVIAILGACSIFLSTLEYLIPKPLPFLRLGLANLPILLSLSLFAPRYVFLLVLIKVVGQGLINGTLFSYVFVFSASGAFASVVVMVIVYRVFSKWISLIGVSILGALASNLVQLWLAAVMVFGSAGLLVGPPFLIVGTVSSVILGVTAQVFKDRSRWMASLEKMGNEE